MPHDYIEVNYDDENDDDIIVVSTTQQKWEKLHGIGDKSERGREDASNNKDEDLIVVGIKPARPIAAPKSRCLYGRKMVDAVSRNCLFLSQNRQFSVFMAAMVVVILTFSWFWRRRKKRKSRKRPSATPQRDNKEKTETHSTTASSTQTKAIQFSKTITTHHTENHEIVTVDQQQSTTTKTTIESTFVNDGVKKSNINEDDNVETAVMGGIQKSATTPHLMRQSPSNSSNDKRHLVRQMAKDIQLVQDVLKEHELDPALAPQIALTLQSSHHLVESHREMHYQQAILTLHQRQLDRQLSERQHRESLQAIKYDPNWEDKLQQQRQQCWNVSKHVTRLWWEVFLVQKLSRGILPMLWQYWRTSDDEIHQNSTTLYKLLRDMAWSFFAQVCDCHGDDSSVILATTESSKTTGSNSWMAAAAVATASTTNNSVAGVLHLVNHWMPYSWIDLDQCTCYGYCLISGCLLLAATTTLHYLLRIMSLPTMCHHTVNVVAFVTFYGMHRITMGILKCTTTVITSVDNRQEMDTTDLAELVILFLLLLLQPAVGYMKTQKLYCTINESVVKSDASRFEDAFRSGQRQMRDWKWEQQVIRYLHLSLYAALLIWRVGNKEMLKHWEY